MKKEEKRKINKRVIVQSILALICLALTFVVSWLFLIPVAIFIWFNQKELFGEN